MFEVQDWGLTDYSEALNRQMGLVEELIVARASVAGPVSSRTDTSAVALADTPATVEPAHAPDKLVFCTHPPVVTLGRGSKSEDVFAWQGDIVEVSRGGRATYHGPNQLVIYPIVDLTRLSAGVDLHKFLRALERAIVEALKQIGVVQAEARTLKLNPEEPSLTGVWVGDKKIASIGIAVKRGISYHGISLNLFRDPHAFQGINPCGFKADIMTSVEDVLGQAPSAEQFKKIFAQEFEKQF